MFGPTLSFVPGYETPRPRSPSTKNIIHSLRVQDPQVHGREVWEEDENPLVEQDCTSPLGGSVPSSSTALVRFGTPVEIAIHHGMRILAVIDLLMVPFIASFDAVYPLRDLPSLVFFDSLLTFLYFCGVAMRLRTSFVNASGLEGKHAAVILRSTINSMSFWADVVALIISPLLHVRGPLGYLCLLRLLKSWRIPPAAQRMMLLDSPDNQVGILVLDILVGFFLCEHLYACAWFWAKVNSPFGYGREWSIWNGWSADALDDSEVTAAQEAEMITSGISLVKLGFFYLYALRDGGFMLAGWGGVETLSVPELVLISFMAPVSACLVAFASGLFVTAVGAAMIKQEQYLIKSASLNAACLDLHLPDELRFRICRYQSYVHIHSMDSHARELIEHLSDNLVGEVRVHRMQKVIEESSFFQDMTAHQILSILGMMVEKVFAPGDIICRKDDPADSMYIIARGSVGIFANQSDTSCFRHMYAGEMVGVAAFLKPDATRTAFVRSETFTVLMMLARDTFQDYLERDVDLSLKVRERVSADARNFTQPMKSQTPTNRMSQVEELEGEDVHERTPLMSERKMLDNISDTDVENLGQQFYPNQEISHEMAPRGDLKSSSRSTVKESIVDSKSNSRSSVKEESGEQQITLQRLYEQLLEFRAESKSRGEALEHQMEELRCAQEKIAAVLLQAESLPGTKEAGIVTPSTISERGSSGL